MTRRELLKSALRAGLLGLMGYGVYRAMQTPAAPADGAGRQGCAGGGACARCRLAKRCPLSASRRDRRS